MSSNLSGLSKLRFKNAYLKNSAWQIAGHLSKIVSNLIVGVLVIRYLGPENYGLLATATAIVYFAQPLASLGLNGILEREIIRERVTVPQTISSALVARLLSGSVLTAIIALVSSFFMQDGSIGLLVLLCIGPVLFNAHSLFLNYFNAYTRSKIIVRGRILCLIFVDIIKIALIINEQGMHWFALLVSVEVGLYLSFGLVAYKLHSPGTKLLRDADPSIMAYLVGTSWPLILSGFAYMVYLRVDILMLQQMVGASSSGIYASATKISEAWYFVGIAISSSLFPAILRARERSSDAFETQIRMLFSILFIVSLSVSVALCLLAPLIISTLYGERFESGIPILQIHLFGGILVFLGFGVSKWLIAENRLKFSLIRHLFGALLNVALNFILIPTYGGLGAAIATVSAHLGANYLFAFAFPQTRRLGILVTQGILTNHFRTIATLHEKNL